jgi:phosphoglycolate phosphatase
MRIVLFDIDGTLVWTKGAGKRAMERALLAVIGNNGPDGHRYDGKTDRQIVREAMLLTGHEAAQVEAHMEAVIARYLTELDVELDRDDHGAFALPGVHALLDAVHAEDDLVLGLLTGNVIPGAERKLRAVGIEPSRFLIGAYGSDHESRPELPPIARARAAALLGRDVQGADCVIIGDTPMDVACGRPIGARAIAVATGHYDVAALTACAPDAVFADLTDTAAVLEAIRVA